jgi:S-DNA-T family DNA segregation ATPase FtsK/SpoIIIE
LSQIELAGGLGLALGMSVTGEAIVADLSACPHLLIAGATGSGKSVCIHSLLCSLLMNHGPDSLQLLLVDPKRVELTAYRGLPHLVRPVITSIEHATTALSWAVSQMDARFDLLSEASQRDILRYNEWARRAGKEPLPYLVIVIDELADLMMQSQDEVEPLICRLAQMARAVGIHLVLATQRPSVDVVTGLIKANIPARIAFQTASSIDSRVILDAVGAEKLLGEGDCFVRLSGVELVRVQGCFVADSELEAITAHWATGSVTSNQGRDRNGRRANIIEGTFQTINKGPDQELLDKAAKVAANTGRVSVSLLQRRLRVSYMKAAELVEALRERGLIGA